MRKLLLFLAFLAFVAGCGDDLPPEPSPDAAVTATNQNTVPDECLGDDCPDGGV